MDYQERTSDREIAETLDRIHNMVVREARAEQSDQRRNGVLNSVASQLQRPVHAARLLTEGTPEVQPPAR